MSVADIKENIRNLSKEERGEITNFIAQLRISEDPDYWTRIRERLEDDNPAHWIPLEEVIEQEK